MDKREAIQILKEELLSERDNDSRYPCVSSPRHYEALDLAIEALCETMGACYLAYKGAREKLQLSPETSTNGSYIRDGRLMHDLVYRGEAEVDTPTNTPTDIISRRAAIQAMAPFDTNHELRDTLEGLPSERESGEWIEDEEQHQIERTYHCSECGFGAWGEYEKTRYCGGCGAKMINGITREELQTEWLKAYCPTCVNNDDRGTEYCNCQAEYEVEKDIGIECIHYEEYHEIDYER